MADPPQSSVLSPPKAAVVSAPGRGAISLVRVWGPGAVNVADRAFRPLRGRGLGETPRGRLRVGRMGAGLGDEVVAVVIEGREEEVEIQCHGGPAAVGMVVEALAEAGARVRSGRAWARHSGGSRLRGEALMDLAKAPTARVAEVLLDQAGGALDDELREIIDSDAESAASRLDRLIARAEIGVRLIGGWRVVLAGRPNVGKSRLLNAIAGYDRSIVDPTPGTTRDVLTVAAAFDGWPVELADTAGLRATLDPIEAEGVARARARQLSADAVLVVLDRSEPLGDLDRSILLEHPGALVVANKCDLPAAWDELDFGAMAISAERGDGVDRLVGAIAGRLVPDPPRPGSGVPFRPAHVRRLAAIRGRLPTDRESGLRSIRRWLS